RLTRRWALRQGHPAARRAANPPDPSERAVPMADEGDVLTDLNPQANGNGADNGPVAGIISQYVKDLSVENPKAPESFQWTEQPELDVQFNIAARQVSDEVSEAELKISCTARTPAGTAYVVELSYC